MTTTDAIPNASQLSRFTRGSVCASLQRRICLRANAFAGKAGLHLEVRARSQAPQTRRLRDNDLFTARNAIAAPVAPVMYCARSANSCNVA